jgi:DivIVA domain-containing protein
MSPERSPLDATGIARQQFSTVRRGYDPAEVRAFLHELSDVVGRLQRGEAHQLDRAERAEARAQLAEQLDEHRLVELLGAETARVLDAAREAAADIRGKAEESAARMISDAQAEAHGVIEQAEQDGGVRKREIVAEAEELRRDAEAILDRRRAEGQALVDEMRRAAEAERERMLTEGEQARAVAEADAQRLRELAREQGRQVVAEAQVVRERMLGDLARRRRTAREQLERLNAARERLLAAYEVVRRTVDEATDELTVALPQAKAASEIAARRVSQEPDPSVDELEAELSVARMAGLVDDLDASDVDVAHIDALIDGGLDAAELHLAEPEGRGRGERSFTSDEPGERRGIWPFRRRTPEDQATTAPVNADNLQVVRPAAEAIAEPAGDVDEDQATAEDSQPVGERATGDVHADVHAASEAEAESSPEAPVPSAGEVLDDGHDQVEELFARLKADREAPADPPGGAADPSESMAIGGTAVAVMDDPNASDPEALTAEDLTAGVEDDVSDHEAEREGGVEVLDPDAAVLDARDEDLEPVERELGRRLKRVLADEQNEVFDLLRRDRPASLDDVVPGAVEHARRYAAAALPDLDAAASAGAASIDGKVTGSCSALATELGDSLVEPMRERITRSFDECEGDLEEVTERLRSLYREWKGQRIGSAVRHYAAAAYAWGLYEVTPPGAELRWLVDRSGDACPDADDNALASGVRKGESFPTGVLCSPAHPDCRCLVIPAGRHATPDGGF